MKELNPQPGGFPFFPSTDLLALQSLFKIGVEDQLKDVGNCVIQGVQVTGTQGSANISAGLIYIGGRICVFDAVTGVNLTSPQYIVASSVVNTNRNYGAGGVAGSKIAYSEYKASLTGTDPGAANRIQLDWTNGVNKRIVRLVQDVANPIYREVAFSAAQVISSASGVYVDTPLLIALKAGSYILTSSVVGSAQDSGSSGVDIYSKIANITTSVDLPNSVCLLTSTQGSTSFGGSVGTIQVFVTVTVDTVFRVKVARAFLATPSFTQINNTAFMSGAVSKFSAIRVA